MFFLSHFEPFKQTLVHVLIVNIHCLNYMYMIKFRLKCTSNYEGLKQTMIGCSFFINDFYKKKNNSLSISSGGSEKGLSLYKYRST